MTKEQYLKVVERVIDSPRNDKLKITRLKNAFEQYVAETNKRIVERLEEESEWSEPTFDEDGFCNDDSWKMVWLDKSNRDSKGRRWVE